MAYFLLQLVKFLTPGVLSDSFVNNFINNRNTGKYFTECWCIKINLGLAIIEATPRFEEKKI